MLVLSRKKDETIVLKREGQSDIRITIVRIDNKNKVRVGIEADKDVTVLRQELERSNDDTIKIAKLT
jgi:carbon storage regulator CsrA